MEQLEKIYYISSTHWDREWHRPFQGFRFQLVKVINEILDVLENDPAFTTFIMDGQTIVLEDFSLIEPERAKKLKKLIEQKRIAVGPWYTMPDELLISGESLIHNLLIGHEVAAAFGAETMKYGYISDIFGHIAQMPQILNGFDIGGALLGRGTNAADCPSHFVWEAPDGSRVTTFKVPEETGYGTFWSAVHLPYISGADPDKSNLIKRACQYIEEERARSPVPVIVLMDGMDHERIHSTAPYIAEELSKIYHCPVVFEPFDRLVETLQKHTGQMPVKKGELIETGRQVCDHHMLIPYTLSSRYDLKAANGRAENALEKWAMPMAALAAMHGKAIQGTYFDLAYRYMVKNHAHDSICGCSLDEVHRDMQYRFRQANLIADEVTREVIRFDLETHVSAAPADARLLTVYNPLPYPRTETITAEVAFDRGYPSQFTEPNGNQMRNSFLLKDAQGTVIPYNLVSIKRDTFVDQPGHLSRQPADTHTITFTAQLPAAGKVEFLLIPSEKPVRYLQQLTTSPRSCENNYIRLQINDNGTLDILDKITSKQYTQLLSYLDDGEIGDGWAHNNPIDDQCLTSQGFASSIALIDDGPAACCFRVTTYMQVPESMNFHRHGVCRSDKTTELRIVSDISLGAADRYVDVRTTVHNSAADHRLRLMIPTGIGTSTYHAGQAFADVERAVGFDRNSGDWKEPDTAERAFNGYVFKREAAGNGLAFLAEYGLRECAALDDEKGSLVVTLFRSFSRTFLTDGQPDGQLQGPLTFHYRLLPLQPEDRIADIHRMRDRLQTGIKTSTCSVPPAYTPQVISNFTLLSDNCVISSLKLPESAAEKTIVVRLYNPSQSGDQATMSFCRPIQHVESLDLAENALYDVPFETNSLTVQLAPWKIATYRISF